MSFQLLNIAVYNRFGERRDIELFPGIVNIITGGSKSGKTALIYIVDYCFGRTECAVPAGVIRDSVAWYVVKVQADNSQLVIGRPAPPQGQQSISDVYLEVGGNLGLPEFSALKKNTTTTALRSFLTEAVGITPNEHVPPEGHSRPPLTANFGHSCFYLFQPQDYIAKRNILFYRQDEDRIPQTIKDTLPYFLGAVGDDRYERIQELRRLRREVRLLERRLAEEASLRGHDNSRALSLFAEAQQVELLTAPAAPDEFGELVEQLRGLLAWEPQTPQYEGENTLTDLQNQREQLRSQARGLDREIEAAKAFALRQEGFSHEVVEQSHRLKSIGLYKDNGDHHACPLCNQDVTTPTPTATNLLHSLGEIEKQMETVARQRPRLEAYITEREEQLAQIKQQLVENRTAIEALVAQHQVLQEHRNRQATQARTVGRISLFLDSLQEATEGESDLQERLHRLQERVTELETELADEGIEDRLDASLRIISDQMSAWARELDLEFADCPLEFDLTNLTVVAYRETGKVRLLDMGSAENWMGYHLVTHFALHKWFIEKHRPAPHFLMLDQPTQVYFPGDPPENGSMDTLDDEDRQKVKHIFQFILARVEELSPEFQVIITDHANLREDWFQGVIVERWWDGVKFIPESWY
jgi:hypothetical protein